MSSAGCAGFPQLGGKQALKVIMSTYQNIGTASDRIVAALVAGLEIEFGRGAGQAMAQRFLDAEDGDFSPACTAIGALAFLARSLEYGGRTLGSNQGPAV